MINIIQKVCGHIKKFFTNEKKKSETNVKMEIKEIKFIFK